MTHYYFRQLLFSTILLTSAAFGAQAQNMGIGTTAPNVKAALEIAASDKGLLIPRLDSVQRTGIGAPPQGLLVYQTNGRAGLWYFQGGWQFLQPGKQADNLGNHTATQNLDLGANQLVGNGGNSGISINNTGAVRVSQLAGTGNGRLVTLAPDGTLQTPGPLYGTAANNTPAIPVAMGAAVATGANPIRVAVNPAGTRVYVVNQNSNTLQAYDASSPVAAPTPVGMPVATGSLPISVVVNPAGSRVYVTNLTSGTLQAYDVSNPAVAPVPVGAAVATGSGPRGLVINAAGTRAYLVNQFSNTLQAYDISNPAVAPVAVGAAVATGAAPFNVGLNPAGTRAYVVNNGDRTLQAYDISDPALAPVPVGAAVSTGLNPSGIAVNPAGTRAYLANSVSNTLQMYDISDPASAPVALGAPVGTFSGPTRVVVNPTGTRAYLLSTTSTTIQAYDISDPAVAPVAVTGSVSTTSGARDLALNTAGSFLYVINNISNTLQAYRLSVLPMLLTQGADGSLGTLDPYAFAVTDTWGSQTAAVNIPLTGNGTSGAPLGIQNASSAQAGALTATDWTTFNNKLTTVTTTGAPLTGAGTAAAPLGLNTASSTQAGALTATDWTTFNNKLTTVTTTGAPLTGAGTAAAPLGLNTASSTQAGALTATDWTTFNNKLGAATNGLTATGTSVGMGGTLTQNTTLNQNGNSLTFSGGNVGVGTTSPSALLQVQGTSYAAAAIDQSQTLRSGCDGGTDQWQSFTAGLTGLMTQLDMEVLSPLSSGADAPGTLSIYAGQGTGGTLLLTQAVTYTNAGGFTSYTLATPVAVTAGQRYTYRLQTPSAQSCWITLRANSPYSSGRSSSDFDLDYVFRTYVQALQTNIPLAALATGAVGIGTVSPSATLEVAGTSSTVKLGGLAGTGTRLVLADASGNLNSAASLAGTGSRLVVADGSGNLSASASALTSGSVIFSDGTTVAQNNANFFWDNTNARLGLGTTSPGQRLHVVGIGRFENGGASLQLVGTGSGSHAFMEFYSDGIAAGRRAYFGFPSNGSQELSLMNTLPSGTVTLGTNATTRVLVDGTGNVGIGTTSPGAKLDIGGTGGFSTSPVAFFTHTGTNGRRFSVGSRTDLASNGTFAISDETAGQTRLLIDNAGYVGIGTLAPDVPLTVGMVNANYTVLNYGFLSRTGTGANVANSGVTSVSIRATGRVVASEFNATSDRRLKTIIGLSDAAADLALLNQLRITDYTMRDRVQFGDRCFKKVIAQEVEAVFPQAVQQQTGFLPDVYALAEAVTAQADTLVRVALPKAAPVAAQGQRVKLLGPQGEVIGRVVCAEGNALLVAGAQALAGTKEVFVYGLEHADVRSVDYEALSMLNVSATQELARKVEALEKRNADLQRQRATDRAETERLRRQLDGQQAALQTMQEQLARLLGESPAGTEARK